MTSDRDGYGMGGERGQANEQPDNAYKKQKRKSEGGCYRRTEKESEGLRSGRNRGGQARGLAAVDAGVQDIQVK